MVGLGPRVRTPASTCDTSGKSCRSSDSLTLVAVLPTLANFWIPRQNTGDAAAQHGTEPVWCGCRLGYIRLGAHVGVTWQIRLNQPFYNKCQIIRPSRNTPAVACRLLRSSVDSCSFQIIMNDPLDRTRCFSFQLPSAPIEAGRIINIQVR